MARLFVAADVVMLAAAILVAGAAALLVRRLRTAEEAIVLACRQAGDGGRCLGPAAQEIQH